MHSEQLEQLMRAMKLWNYVTFQDKVGKHLPSWRMEQSSLLEKASASPPKSKENTVTAFTDWIYSLYAGEQMPSDLAHGSAMESLIEAKRKAQAATRNHWPDSMFKLIYNGMGDNPDPALRISRLRIDGQCLMGRPDLVFQNLKTDELLIVEIKVSDADPPDGGWPNLKAQLWAYSLADAFADYQNVYLLAEIWKKELGQTVPLRMPAHDAESRSDNEALFTAFGGEIVRPG